MIEDFTITELAQAVLEAQDSVQLGDNLSELDSLDIASLKAIITKAMNEDKFLESSINPANLIIALYKTYISPKTSSKALIIKAYTDAIEKAYNLGYFRIDISGYKTLSKQQRANKENEANI